MINIHGNARGARPVAWLVASVVSAGLAGAAAPAIAATPEPPAPPARWQLDPSFGDGGTAVTYFQDDSQHGTWGFDVAMQPDGKIVIAADSHRSGPPGPSPSWMGAARYLPNGELDPTFGDGGIVEVAWGRAVHTFTLELQQIGDEVKIVVGGHLYAKSSPRHRFAVMRLNADGSLDTKDDADPDRHLGRDGRKAVAFAGDQAFGLDLTISPDRRIVVAGYVDVGAGDHVPALARLLPRSGRLDPAFGDDGRLTLDVGGQFETVTADRGPEGVQIVAGGGVRVQGGGTSWHLARFDHDGALDPTFGDGGTTRFRMSTADCAFSYQQASDVAVTAEGKVVAVGDGCVDDEIGAPVAIPAVARLRPNGSLDPSFSDDGRAFPVPDLPADASEQPARGLELGSDGRIFWSGWIAYPSGGPRAQMFVGGLRANGSPDPQFGPAGYQQIDVGPGPDEAEAITSDGDGRLVVVGLANAGGLSIHDGIALARLRLPS